MVIVTPLTENDHEEDYERCTHEGCRKRAAYRLVFQGTEDNGLGDIEPWESHESFTCEAHLEADKDALEEEMLFL